MGYDSLVVAAGARPRRPFPENTTCRVRESIRSCCSGVFVDQSAESVASVELVCWFRIDEVWARSWCRWCQSESTVRPVGVVVVDVDAHDMLELSATDDQEPVEAVAADGADPAFGERVRLRCAKRGADDPDALAPEDLVEAAAELTWIRNRAGVVRSESDQPSWRACWHVQRPSGFAVQSRQRLRVDPIAVQRTSTVSA